MREQRAAGHAGVAKEAVNRVEKSCQPVGIKTRRQAALREACPQVRIALAFGRSLRIASRGKDAEIAPVHEGKSKKGNAANNRKKRLQRRPERACSQPGQKRPEPEHDGMTNRLCNINF